MSAATDPAMDPTVDPTVDPIPGAARPTAGWGPGPGPGSLRQATVSMVRLDLFTVRPFARQAGLFLVVAGVLALTMGDPTFALSIGAVFAALMVSYPFAAADRNDLETLYATLPLPRRAFLAGRYLFAVLLFAATLAVMALLALLVGALSGSPLGGGAALAMLATCVALFATVVAVQFPVFFRLGYLRARLVAIVPFVLLAPGVVLLDRLDVRWTPPSPPAALALALGYAVAVLVASAALAGRLLERRGGRRSAPWRGGPAVRSGAPGR